MFKSKAKTDPVRRLIWRLVAVMLMVASLLIAVVLYSGKLMDSASLDNDRALIENSFNARLAGANSELRSVAWWDEAVVRSGSVGFDIEWLDLELGAFMVDSYSHDLVVVLDEDNEPVYTYGNEAWAAQIHKLVATPELSKLINQVRGGANVSPRIGDINLLNGNVRASGSATRKSGRSSGAIAKLDNKPVLVSAMAIVPSVDNRLWPQRPRILVSFIELDTQFLNSVGTNTLLRDVQFSSANSTHSGSLEFKSDSGAEIGLITWSARAPGTHMVKRIMPWILGCLLAAIAMMATLMIKLTISTKRLAARELEAQHLANHDSLTGLPNRRHLEQELFMRGASVSSHERLACAIIDLDRFKDINDTLGHAAGDALVKAVAERLSTSLPHTDFVSRLGGDEFAVLRDCRELGDADDLSKAIASVFGRPFPVMGHDIETGASVGVAMSSSERAVEELMREADIALYEAKARQKGTAVQFAPAMASKIEQRRALEVDLKTAISNRWLTLAYQPIVEAASGKITSVEALVRWNSTKHGSVSPDIFVAIAEETGMMADLGRFVIEQAIEDSQRWPGITTAINISPAQLRSSSIMRDLMTPVKAHGVSPTQIVLEVTESLLMSNDQRTLRTLRMLKDNGFGLALDDFGTGYSSLAYVRDFPFDKLKIDRSFVRGQTGKGRSLSIMKAVVNFGRILGREVVAEGVETEHEMQAMQAAGVTHLQGFLFSKPITAVHLEALIAASGRLTAARTKPVGDEEEASAVIDRSLAGKVRRIA